MQKVVIYTGPMCNYCEAAKHLLSKKKVDYTEFNIATDQAKMQEMQEMQQMQERFLPCGLPRLLRRPVPVAADPHPPRRSAKRDWYG